MSGNEEGFTHEEESERCNRRLGRGCETGMPTVWKATGLTLGYHANALRRALKTLRNSLGGKAAHPEIRALNKGRDCRPSGS